MKSDEEMLSLDIGTLVKRYPDLSHDQLLCLLMLRGDLSKGDAKDTTLEFVPEGNAKAGTLHAESIRSQVKVTPGIINNPFGKESGPSLNPFADTMNPFSKDGSAANLNPFNRD